MKWLGHVLGLDNASGHWYLFWSGFAGDLSYFGALAIVWRKFNCHTKGCWRIALHHSDGVAACPKHRGT